MFRKIAGLADELMKSRREQERRNRFPAITLLVVLLVILLLFLFAWWRWPSLNQAAVKCGQTVVAGHVVNPKPALGAYELWLSMGNTGSEQDLLDALVGTPGDDGYIGSDGLSGADGKSGKTGVAGKSAYQLWLDGGNTGTPQDFIDSLAGTAGTNGTNGLSAYELWLSIGHTGTTEDFFNSLAGVPGSQGATGNTGASGRSAYQIWMANGNSGTESDFLKSLVGQDGVDGAPGICSVGDTGASGQPGASGAPGAAGLSAYEIWLTKGGVGSVEVFLASLIGPTGAPGPTGATGAAGPPGVGGLGYSGNFWDVTTQGGDGLVSTSINTAYPVYLSEADTANNSGVSVVRCAGDADRPDGYPAVPKSCITFSHAGVYNISFSAQLYRTAGGSADVFSFWLREDGHNVGDTNTDVTLVANGQKQVAAWNFFVPVTCNGSCSTYQLMWSVSGGHSNLWYEAPQTNPARPAIPSVILTVNQVR